MTEGRGLFITIEGGDGAGKSTQIENISRFFEEKGLVVMHTREPGGTAISEKLMAAERAGITKVFIPEENMFDLKDVADEVKDKIEIVPVSNVGDVLRETGVLAATAVNA